MKQATNYETDTLTAYRTRERAAEYKRYHTTQWSWGRVMTWWEQRALRRELSRYSWIEKDRLLDIPCGTGVLGELLHSFPFRILASDISPEMMELARSEYPQKQLEDCVQADITDTKFSKNSFSCIVTLGFFHRVPLEIKRAALRELSTLTNKTVIMTCSVDTPSQRFKKSILSALKKDYVPAPCPITYQELLSECEAAGFRVARSFMVLPFFSAVAMLVLEKK